MNPEGRGVSNYMVVVDRFHCTILPHIAEKYFLVWDINLCIENIFWNVKCFGRVDGKEKPFFQVDHGNLD